MSDSTNFFTTYQSAVDAMNAATTKEQADAIYYSQVQPAYNAWQTSFNTTSPAQDNPNYAALAVQGGNSSQSPSLLDLYGSHLVNGVQVIPQAAGYNAQTANEMLKSVGASGLYGNQTPYPMQQPSWMGDWQSMQNQFNTMMQQLGTQYQQQQQTQPTYGYNYQPQYQNALMRPITPTSGLGQQKAPSQMGYQNRTSLWGNV